APSCFQVLRSIMQAITASRQLFLADSASLKQPPSSLSPCLPLLASCQAAAWAPDNSSLNLATGATVHRYNPFLNSLAEIYTVSSGNNISHFLSRGKDSLVFAVAERIHVLESTKITQTIEVHKSPITTISISSSNDLLASASSSGVHIHNLSLNSHTVLRGLQLPAGQCVTACAFHPHTRTRLLVGAGKQLFVYETTRPSSPLKTISLNDASVDPLVSISCSPFSKTLVATASSNGCVSLVDLEKEKGLFRTLNLKVELTCLTFSQDGSLIYLGTASGKLLLLDLRALDKPPKVVIISEDGSPVETISVQRKLKTPESTAKPLSTAKEPAVTTKPKTLEVKGQQDPSPAKRRTEKEKLAGVSSRKLLSPPANAHSKVLSPSNGVRERVRSHKKEESVSTRPRKISATESLSARSEARRM
ncbi:unnamed protein product, partial [Mycena citricolor]